MTVNIADEAVLFARVRAIHFCLFCCSVWTNCLWTLYVLLGEVDKCGVIPNSECWDKNCNWKVYHTVNKLNEEKRKEYIQFWCWWSFRIFRLSFFLFKQNFSQLFSPMFCQLLLALMINLWKIDIHINLQQIWISFGWAYEN